MKPNLNCPDCGALAVSHMKKVQVVVLGSTVQCKRCGATLTAGGHWLGWLLGAVLGSGLFVLLAYSVSTKIWWPLVVAFLVVFLVPQVLGYFVALRRIGTKRFYLG